MTIAAATCRVFDVQRFSIHDGPGIRTTVFLEGCPLRCAWCQNPEAFRAGRAPVRTAASIVAEVLEDRDYYAASGGGMTLSGGEPLLHAAPAIALLEEAKRHGLHTCVQTSGAVPEANLAAVLGLVDVFQLDLKHMSPRRHRELTGAGCERVHESAAFLLVCGAAVELRLPVIPGVNDDAENLDEVARFLLAHGVRALPLVPYHRLYLHKYAELGLEPAMRAVEPPSPAALVRVIARLLGHGIASTIDG
jgi:pyruvate formate lyase activating enzyme